MNRYGIEIAVKNVPKLDPEFMPILQFNRAFLKTAKKPVSIATPLSPAPPRWPRPTTTM